MLFCQALERDNNCREALEYLAGIYLQSGRPDAALDSLQQLVRAYPDEPLYCDRLATLLERRDASGEAVEHYLRLLGRRPGLVTSRYNLARLLKKLRRYDEALLHYHSALEAGIEVPEEIYSNISAIYSELKRDEDARAALQQALDCNPEYIPALYNMGLLSEEQGDWPQALKLFRQILLGKPNYSAALVRIAHGQKVAAPDDPLFAELQQALSDSVDSAGDREDLHFALGKVLDDCGDYPLAFGHYLKGNRDSSVRMGRYDRGAQEVLTAKLRENFSASALAAVEPISDAAPIFICGMFRSGSTLVEQILAAHPQLVGGGELGFFSLEAPLPTALPARMQLRELAAKYIDTLNAISPGANVLNKRPDNFLYLGLIKALFPNARIINTSRNALDNCLSVFFQQIDLEQHKYANDLLDTGHYYSEYRQLMDHWKQIFPDNILDVNYEALVAEPETSIRSMLDFLQLDWHSDCLNFHTLKNRVRTASVWQVRQPLYTHSAGRWRNYQPQLDELRSYLGVIQ